MTEQEGGAPAGSPLNVVRDLKSHAKSYVITILQTREKRDKTAVFYVICYVITY